MERAVPMAQKEGRREEKKEREGEREIKDDKRKRKERKKRTAEKKREIKLNSLHGLMPFVTNPTTSKKKNSMKCYK